MTWHEKTDLPWMKVYMAWWRSPSHIELGASALYIGLALMGLANERGRQEDGSGWVLNAKNAPMSMRAIARHARVTEAEAEEAIDELVECGTMARRDDGAVGFPSLQKWQEDSSAERQRRRRSRPKRDSHADVTPDVTPRSRTDDKRNRGRDTTASPSEKLVLDPPAPRPTAVLVYPTKGKAKQWALTEDQLARWQELYSVEVLAECRKALAWLEANPQRQKTPGGMPKFLTNWLNRQQDKGPSHGTAPPKRESAYQTAKRKADEAVARVQQEAMRGPHRRPGDDDGNQRRIDESSGGGDRQREPASILALLGSGPSRGVG